MRNADKSTGRKAPESGIQQPLISSGPVSPVSSAVVASVKDGVERQSPSAAVSSWEIAPLEVRLERLNDSLNKLRQLQEKWDYRLIVPKDSLLERYKKGTLNILVEFRLMVGGNSHDFYAVFKSKYATAGPEAFGGVKTRSQLIFSACPIGNGDDCLMFVDDVEVVQGPQGIIPSSVWFQGANHINDIWCGPVYVFISDLRFESVGIFSKREFNSLDLATNLDTHEVIRQEVERSSEIMNSVSNDCRKVIWERFRKAHYDDFITSLIVNLGNDSARCTLIKGGNRFVQFRDMALGPFNL